MRNTTENKWLVDDDLVYRLTNGSNCDEITVTMANGSRSMKERKVKAKEIMLILNAIPDLLDILHNVDLGYTTDNIQKLIAEKIEYEENKDEE